MTLSECRSIFGHMEWADALAWKAVLGRPQQDQRVRDLLYHYHSTQWAYLQVWRGEAVRLPEASTFAGLAAVGSWARGYYRELRGYLDVLQEPSLLQTVRFPWATLVAERYGSAEPATLAESMLQIGLHSAHHRGQVATWVREHAGEPAVTDFIAWVWMGRPAPDWAPLDAAV
jgi:uncharacterized damage-inducible protein DinB